MTFLPFPGGLAHMVERSLCMREVPGSMPGSSRNDIFFFSNIFFLAAYINKKLCVNVFDDGGVAQVVERSLSMREVPGSIPGTSKTSFPFFAFPSQGIYFFFPA